MVGNGKPEEYREIKPYWIRRLLYDSFQLNAPVNGRILVNGYEWRKPIEFDIVQFKNGYGKNSPIKIFEWNGLEKRTGNPEWGAIQNEEYFVIKLGNQK